MTQAIEFDSMGLDEKSKFLPKTISSLQYSSLIKIDIFNLFAARTDEVMMMATLSQLKILLPITNDNLPDDSCFYECVEIAVDSCLVRWPPRLVAETEDRRGSQRAVCLMKKREYQFPRLCLT